MATNLKLDDSLINEAVALGHHRTKREAVTEALTEYICHLRQQRILDLFGKVDFQMEYDYKQQRSRV
jgi:Arc/MetJ family transcription regulator